MLLDPTLRLRRLLRVALSHYVLNGLSVALGLLVISAGVHWWLGAFAASGGAVAASLQLCSAAPTHTATQQDRLLRFSAIVRRELNA